MNSPHVWAIWDHQKGTVAEWIVGSRPDNPDGSRFEVHWVEPGLAAEQRIREKIDHDRHRIHV